jgi:hypothetical protein
LPEYLNLGFKGIILSGKWRGLITEACIFLIYVNSGKSRGSSRRKSEDAARPLFEQRPGWQRAITSNKAQDNVCSAPVSGSPSPPECGPADVVI